ncbi:SRPBCC domain-containing protein [Streptomyces sp. Go-475]|uniref:SRPBCC domain-containing protein n=1 Tax=Streptomyces sp. Go-475 TaxID=2072505 RepID=UPI000DEEB3A7|nr:SRPBCC domain-containing protein [Streptomyces sp. Go-475]
MEHEVFVPVPAERLREVLDDPARVARAVPGLQQDAGAEPVAGRLKLRVGSHSVTYRGALRLSRRDDGAYAVEGEAEESRGSGSVTLAVRIALREADDGCTVVFDGTASAKGRITDLPPDAVEGAVTRLLNRFAEHLAAAAPDPTAPLATQDFEPRATTDYETTPDADDTPPPPPPARTEEGAAGDSGTVDDEAPGESDEDAPGVAEAAHARRTMIGRSAEEVDHAPPRGRYAPVPAPQTVSPPAPLRWAAPAAALAVASAIVAVRALRRRR